MRFFLLRNTTGCFSNRKVRSRIPYFYYAPVIRFERLPQLLALHHGSLAEREHNMQVRAFIHTGRFTLTLTLIAAFLFGCTANAGRYQNQTERQELANNNGDSTPDQELGRLAAKLALEQIGAPYHYGGVSPAGFDCSGLVYYVYSKVGVALPRRASRMARVGRRISVDQLLPGDLLFFNIKGSRASHVGIYLNKGEFVHATKSGDPVRKDTLANPWWSRRLMAATRVY